LIQVNGVITVETPEDIILCRCVH